MFLGVIAGVAVLNWPRSPLWTRVLHLNHELVQFSEDGKSLIVTDGWRTNRAASAQPALLYIDLESGEIAKRVALTFPPQTFICRFWLSPDAKSIFAHVGMAVQGMDNASTGYYSLIGIDAATGKQLFDPITPFTSTLDFSKDRKWYWYHVSDDERVDASSEDYSKYRNTLRFVSTIDFRIVHTSPFNPSLQAFHEVCFIEGEPKVAVMYTKWPGKSLHHLAKDSPEKLSNLQQVMEVWDLESKQKIKSMDLPGTHRWHKIVKADNHELYLSGDPITATNKSESVSNIARMVWGSGIDMESVPTLSSYTRGMTPSSGPGLPIIEEAHSCEAFGSDWVLHTHRDGRPRVGKKWTSIVDWIDKQCGTSLSKNLNPATSVCVTDRETGNVRLQIATGKVPECLVSNDGNYLAIGHYEEPGITLWRIKQQSRWPYAIGVWVLTLLVLTRRLCRIRLLANIPTSPAASPNPIPDKSAADA